MRSILVSTGNFISSIFDFFYPPFGKYLKMNIRLYRYAMSGSVNVVFGWVLFYTIYNFVLAHRTLDLGFIMISSHQAPFVITSPITFLTGFLLQKYVTFTESDLRGKVQFVRYLLVFGVNACINSLGIEILVNYGFYPTPSNMIMTIICIIFSYISQHFFTFKTINKKE
jgi:putative flippase GtrA